VPLIIQVCNGTFPDRYIYNNVENSVYTIALGLNVSIRYL